MKLFALVVFKVNVVRLHRALQVRVLHGGHADLARVNVIVRDAVRAHADLSASLIVANDLGLGSKGQLHYNRLKGERSNGQSQAAVSRKGERQRYIELVAALGESLSLFKRVELADHLAELLTGLGAQLFPHVQKRVRQGVNDRRGDGQSRALRQLVADRIVPARGVCASEDLAVLADGDQARQRITSVHLPAKVSLAREGVLGLSAKLALGGRGVEINGLHCEGRVLGVHKAPEGVLRFSHSLGSEDLVSLAVRGELRVNGTFSGTHFDS